MLPTSRRRELRIEGVATNIPFLQAVQANGGVHSGCVDEFIAELVAAADAEQRQPDVVADRAAPSGLTGAQVDTAIRWRCSHTTTR